MSQPYFTITVPAEQVGVCDKPVMIYDDGHRSVRTEATIRSQGIDLMVGHIYIDADTPDDLNALAARIATIAGEWLDELNEAGGTSSCSAATSGYAFGVDDFGWDLSDRPVEDLGYELGWAALGEPGIDDDGCEAARAMGAAIVATPEMQAIKAVLRHHAKEYSLAKQAVGTSASKREVLAAWGLPAVVVEWVLS